VVEIVLIDDLILVISVVYVSIVFSYLVISVLMVVISLSIVFFSSSLAFSTFSLRISSLEFNSFNSVVTVTLRDLYSFSFLVYLVVSSSYLIFLVE